jgi:hypothetical protein
LNKLYLKIAYIALKPSIKVIFLPSA